MGNQYISECQIITNNVAVTGCFTAGCYLGAVVRSVANKCGNVTLAYSDIPDRPQPGASSPQGLGSPTAGSSTSYARHDHIHPACLLATPPTNNFGVGIATTEFVKNQAHLIDSTILPNNPSGPKSGLEQYAGPANYLFALGQHQHPSDSTKLNVSGGLLTGSLSGTQAFFNYLSAGRIAGDGSLITNVVSQDSSKLPLVGGTLTGGLTGTTAVFNFLSGDGSQLINVIGTDPSKIPLAGGTFSGGITGTNATFNNVSAVYLFGDGSNLTNTFKPVEQAKFDSINITNSPTNGQQIGYCVGSPQAESLAVGYQASSTGICSTVIGNSAVGGIAATALGLAAAAGSCSVAVGFLSKSNNSTKSTIVGACASIAAGSNITESVAVGFQSSASNNATSVGSQADSKNCGVAVGQLANAGIQGGVAVGSQAKSNNAGTAVGFCSNAENSGASLGREANACDQGVAVGINSTGSSGGVALGFAAIGSQGGVAIGCCANSSNVGSVAIGKKSTAHTGAVSVGDLSCANDKATAIGSATIAGCESIAIGNSAEAAANSIAIGNCNKASCNQIVIGSNNSNSLNSCKTTSLGNCIASTGSYSVNVGYDITSADSSTAIGINVKASPCSVVIGDESCSVQVNTIASGPSIVVGNKVIAREASVGVGYNTNVSCESVAVGSHICSTEQSISIGDCSIGCKDGVAIGYNAYTHTCSIGIGNCSVAYDRSTGVGYGSIATIGSTSIGCGAWSRCFSTVIGIHSGAVTYGSIGIGPDAKIRGFCIKDICSALDFANFPHAYALSKTTALSPLVCDVGLGYSTCPQLYIPGANISGCGIPRDTVICTVTPDPNIKCKVRLTLSNVVQPGFTSNSNLLKVTHPYVCFQDAEMACACNILTISSTSPEDEKGVYRRLFNANADLSNADTYGSSSEERIAGFYGGHIHCGRLPGAADANSLSPGSFPSYANVRCALYDGWGSAVLIEENSPGQGNLRRVNLSTGLRTKYACAQISCCVTPEDINTSGWDNYYKNILVNPRYSLATDSRYLYVADSCTHTLGFIDLSNAAPGSQMANISRNCVSDFNNFNSSYNLGFNKACSGQFGFFQQIQTVSGTWQKATDPLTRNFVIQPLIAATPLDSFSPGSAYSFGFRISNGSGVPNETGTPYLFVNPLCSWSFNPTANRLFDASAPQIALAQTLMLSTVRFNEPRFIQHVYNETTREKSLYVINTSRKTYIDGNAYEVDGDFGPQFGYMIFKIRLGNASDTGTSTYKTPVSSTPFAVSVTPIASLNKVVSGISTSLNDRFTKTITNITGMTVDPVGNIYVSVRAEDTRVNGFSATRFYDANNNASGQFLSDLIIKIPSAENLWHPSGTFSTSSSAYAINNGTRYPNFRYPAHMAIDKYDNLLVVDQMVADNHTSNPYTSLKDEPNFVYPQAFYTRIRKITPQGHVSTLQVQGGAVLDGKNNFDLQSGQTQASPSYFNSLSSLFWNNTPNVINKLSASNVAGFGIAYDPIRENIFISCQTNSTIQLLSPLSLTNNAVSGIYVQTRFAGASTQEVPASIAAYAKDSLDQQYAQISRTNGNRLLINLNRPKGLSLDYIGASVPQLVGPNTWNLGGTIPYLYVADSDSNSIRRINADPSGDGASILIAGGTKTLGTATTSAAPNGITYTFYSGDSLSIETGGVTKVFDKNFEAGYVNSGTNSSVGKNAMFKNPSALALSNNGQYLYVSDTGNLAIRRITLWTRSGNNIIPSILGENSYATVTTVAGAGPEVTTGSSGAVDGAGNNARFRSPGQIVVEEVLNNTGGTDTILYVADSSAPQSPNQSIRKIFIPHNWNGNSSSTIVSTFIGPQVGAYYPSRFGQPGMRKGLYDPRGLVRDKNGNFYVSETYNSTIRKISPQGLVIDYAGAPSKTGVTPLVTPNTLVTWPIVDTSFAQTLATDSATVFARRNLGAVPSVSTNYPAIMKNANKDWRSILSGRFSGIHFNDAYSMRLSAIFNERGIPTEPNAIRWGVTTSSLSGFLSNISYMTYRSDDQSTAADQIFILTSSPVLSSTVINRNSSSWGSSPEFWQLGAKPSNSFALSGLWGMVTNGFGKFKGHLQSISVNPATITDAITSQTGLVNNSLLIDSTVGYYASFSNPVALLPHYKLASYPETLAGDRLMFPFSNSLAIIDSSSDGSRSVVRKKIINPGAAATYNTNTYRFGPVQTMFGNIYNSASSPGTVSGITGILDGLAYTNPDGTPKYPYQDYVVTNTGKTYNNIYLTNSYHGLIYRYNILTKSISAIAGTAGLPGNDSNPPNIDPVFMMPPSIGSPSAGVPGQSYITFKNPRGLAISNDQSQLYVADTQNHLIRRISNPETAPTVSTIAGRLSSGVLFVGNVTSQTGLPLSVSASRTISVSGREMGAAELGTFEFPTKLHLSTFTTNAGNISAHPFGTYLNRLSGGNSATAYNSRFRSLNPGDILYIADREIIRKLYLGTATLSCVGNLSAASVPPANFNGGGNAAGLFFNPGSPYNNSHLLSCYPESNYGNVINPIIDVSGDSTGRVYYARKFVSNNKDSLYMVDSQELSGSPIFSTVYQVSSIEMRPTPNVTTETLEDGSTVSTPVLSAATVYTDVGIGFEGRKAQIKAIHSDGVGSKIFIAGSQQEIETRDNYQIVWELLTADRTYSNLFEVARDQGQKSPKGVEKYTQLAYDISLDKAIAGDKYLHMINYDFNKSSSVRDTLYFSTYKLTDGFDLKVGMAVELYAATWASVTPTEMTGNLLPRFTYVTAILDENRVVVSKPLSATSQLILAPTVIPTEYTSTGTKRLTAKFQRIDYRVMIPITLTNNSNNVTLPSTGLSAVDTGLLKVGDYLIDIVEPFSQVIDGVLTESYISVTDKYYPPFEENDKTEGMGKKHPRTIVEIPLGAGSSFRLSQRAAFASSVLPQTSVTVMGLFYPGPGIAIGRNATTTLNSSLAFGSASQPLALNAALTDKTVVPARYVRVTVNGLDYMMPLYNIPDGL